MFYTLYVLTLLLFNISEGEASTGFFVRKTEEWLSGVESTQLNYGMAVTDVDRDGKYEIFVAGYSGANLVLDYDETDDKIVNIAQEGTEFAALRDERGQAIGVAACDIDGDGREEIYVLNTNQAYAGRASYGDKIFKWRNGAYTDLFSDALNSDISAKEYAGRSVACIDRYGSGKYGFLVATYSNGGTGKFALIEMDESNPQNDITSGTIALKNVAKEAGLDKSTGGRGIVVGPILSSNGKLDAFFDNEGNSWMGNNGDNFLMKNLGNGKFVDVASSSGVADPNEAGRGVALADLNQDGLFDIIYGNWDGPHRIFMQRIDSNGERKFSDIAPPAFQERSLVRTVMVADFDNDAKMEIMINNIKGRGQPQPNRLFKVTPRGPSVIPGISELPIGDAEEKNGYGTGGAYIDFDGDGMLEMFLSHGESFAEALTVYKAGAGQENNWIRVDVRTKYGAPARGSVVKIRTNRGSNQFQVIDSGSGYLCQMEPVAHFGLGTDLLQEVQVQWPDGKSQVYQAKNGDVNKMLTIHHPEYAQNMDPRDMASDSLNIPAGIKSEVDKAVQASFQEMLPVLEEAVKKEVAQAFKVKSHIWNDKLDQMKRQGSIRITGIKEEEDEQESDLIEAVVELSRAVGVYVDPSSISKAFRMGKKRGLNSGGRSVIVHFNGKREVEDLMMYKERLRNNDALKNSRRFESRVSMIEDLTGPRRKLMKRIKDHPNVELVSVKDGSLFVKQRNGPQVKVEGTDDLAKLGISDVDPNDIYG